MNIPKTFFITTPIYYVNGRPHIGSALTTLCCDFLARYHKLRGERVWLLTGTDEQATKVVEAAQKAGIPTQAFVDSLAQDFKDTWKFLGIEYDDFIRTTEPRHVTVVQEVFRRLQASGDIYKGNYEGWYCVADETYFRDSDVGPDHLCPNSECRQPLRRMQEENYFFRLSAYGDRLLDQIKSNPDFLQPEFRRNEVTSFIGQGLRDMSVARPGTEWGIEVPGDPGQRVYVWFDALINYLAATGWPNNDQKFCELWPANAHVMGKEIYVRFHATLWPAMLMALHLPLPRQIYAHGWWVDSEGKKSGKRTGGLPHPVEFAHEIAAASTASIEIATDSLRYLMLREMGFHGDTEFTHEGFLHRYNTDLANDLGNLCNRSVTMLSKYFDGIVPNPVRVEESIATLAQQTVVDFEAAVKDYRFNGALESAWQLVGEMNRYIELRKPWSQAKLGETDELGVTIYTCLEALRIVAWLIRPAMPFVFAKLLTQLGIRDSEILWSKAVKWGGIPPGTLVPGASPMFPRIQEQKPESAGSAKQKEKTAMSDVVVPNLEIAESVETKAPEFISIDDFMKVELKIGTIVTAEAVPKATKLLKLGVEVGEEIRTILSGIAEMYQPDELVGKQVVVVTNLAPRKMRGIESQGMLLAADVDGQAILVQPETKTPSGSRVR